MSTILSSFALFVKGISSILSCSEEYLIEDDPQALFELSVGEPIESWDSKKQAAVLTIELEAIVPVDWSQCVLQSF